MSKKSFSLMLEQLIYLSGQVTKEEILGERSNYWDYTYGFGKSEIHRELEAVKKELDSLMEKIRK